MKAYVIELQEKCDALKADNDRLRREVDASFTTYCNVIKREERLRGVLTRAAKTIRTSAYNGTLLYEIEQALAGAADQQVEAPPR